MLAVAGGVIGAAVGTLVLLTARIAWYEAKTSRIPVYEVRPILGAAIGLPFYAAIRGGLITAASDVDVLNPYAVIAFAATAGYAQEKILKRLQDTLEPNGKPPSSDEDKDLEPAPQG